MVQPERTAAPIGHGRPVDGTSDARAAIVIVSREASVRKALSEELSGRYGMDYRIVACDEPAQLDPMIRELLAAGTPVALLIGGVGEADPDGIEVLARVRGIDRTVLRVAAVRWGEWDTARPVFAASASSGCPVRRPSAPGISTFPARHRPTLVRDHGVAPCGGRYLVLPRTCSWMMAATCPSSLRLSALTSCACWRTDSRCGRPAWGP